MKKGQAAMEFLMTYGWAILVVIAAIAALAYFGVLDPAKLLPERCVFPAGMDCIGKAITTTTVTVSLRNNQGFPVTIQDLAVSGTACAGAEELAVGATNDVFATVANQSVSNNEVFKARVTCSGLTAGNKFDEDFTVTFRNTESGLTTPAVGEVRGRIA